MDSLFSCFWAAYRAGLSESILLSWCGNGVLGDATTTFRHWFQSMAADTL
jgi:hypothetical protein